MPSAETPAEGMRLYARALRRHWLLALAIVAVAAAAGYVVARASPTTYGATAKVLLDQQKQVDVVLGAGGYSTDPERELNTGVMLVTEEPIAAGVRDALKLPETPAALAAKVTAAIDRNSSIVSITARDASAKRAARIADGFAIAYRDYRARAAQSSMRDAIDTARRRLAELPAGSAEQTALGAELQRLEVAAAFRTGGVQVVRRAAAGPVSVRPRPVLSAFVGGVLGIVLAGLAIVILARTDDRVRDRRDLEAATGRPVVAMVPAGRRAARDVLTTLAVSMSPGRPDAPVPHVLLLTSAGPGEGTPEIGLGLADALGGVGRTIIVAEADLRAPALAAELGLDGSGGVAAILRGESSLERELIELEGADPGGPAVLVVPGGALSGLPQPLLAGERMADLVRAARRRADVVLLIGAPVGAVGDALPLVSLADGVVLVARLGITGVEELRGAMRALEGVGATPVGVVATIPPRRGLLAGSVRRIRALLRRSAPQEDMTRAAGAGGTQEATAG